MIDQWENTREQRKTFQVNTGRQAVTAKFN